MVISRRTAVWAGVAVAFLLSGCTSTRPPDDARRLAHGTLWEDAFRWIPSGATSVRGLDLARLRTPESQSGPPLPHPLLYCRRFWRPPVVALHWAETREGEYRDGWILVGAGVGTQAHLDCLIEWSDSLLAAVVKPTPDGTRLLFTRLDDTRPAVYAPRSDILLFAEPLLPAQLRQEHPSVDAAVSSLVADTDPTKLVWSVERGMHSPVPGWDSLTALTDERLGRRVESVWREVECQGECGRQVRAHFRYRFRDAESAALARERLWHMIELFKRWSRDHRDQIAPYRTTCAAHGACVVDADGVRVSAAGRDVRIDATTADEEEVSLEVFVDLAIEFRSDRDAERLFERWLVDRFAPMPGVDYE